MNADVALIRHRGGYTIFLIDHIVMRFRLFVRRMVRSQHEQK
jgi:hypothetical protein